MYDNMYAEDYTFGAKTAYAYAAFLHKQTFTGFFNRVFLHLAPEIWQGCDSRILQLHMHKLT